MSTKTHNRKTTDHYFELVKAFPLKAIHDEAQYDHAVEMVNKLAVRGEDALNGGERDYLEALTVFIQAYDAAHHAIDLSKSTPLSTLKYLMAEHKMNVNALGKIIGSQPAASLIVNGKRGISRAQAVKLGTHFGVNWTAFM